MILVATPRYREMIPEDQRGQPHMDTHTFLVAGAAIGVWSVIIGVWSAATFKFLVSDHITRTARYQFTAWMARHGHHRMLYMSGCWDCAPFWLATTGWFGALAVGGAGWWTAAAPVGAFLSRPSGRGVARWLKWSTVTAENSMVNGVPTLQMVGARDMPAEVRALNLWD